MFLGDELTELLDALEAGRAYSEKSKSKMSVGVDVLPSFTKDTTDRNRTSPFAFTGNKFEFRMLGSSLNIACPNYILNTIVAEALRQFADQLEQSEDFESALHDLIVQNYTAHKRIIFNGNNYADEWVEEAAARGLYNLRTTVDALPHYISQKNVDLFTRHQIFTEPEMHSRYEILLENYVKVLNIESLTMLNMARKKIVPAVVSYIKQLTETAAAKLTISSSLPCETERALIHRLSLLLDAVSRQAEALESALAQTPADGALAQAEYYRDKVIPAMTALRSAADQLEPLVDKALWPFPTYSDLLFSVN